MIHLVKVRFEEREREMYLVEWLIEEVTIEGELAAAMGQVNLGQALHILSCIIKRFLAPLGCDIFTNGWCIPRLG